MIGKYKPIKANGFSYMPAPQYSSCKNSGGSHEPLADDNIAFMCFCSIHLRSLAKTCTPYGHKISIHL